MFAEVSCQRFFVSGPQSSFFLVTVNVHVLDTAQELVDSTLRGHVDVL